MRLLLFVVAIAHCAAGVASVVLLSEVRTNTEAAAAAIITASAITSFGVFHHYFRTNQQLTHTPVPRPQYLPKVQLDVFLSDGPGSR